jgi:hypothetical protein
MENDQMIYIATIAIIAIVIGLYFYKSIPSKIPFVIIAYNNLFFIRKFINQIKKYGNPIILFDNNSTYEPLLNYYKDIKAELGSMIDIRLMDDNYGIEVTSLYKDTLPDVYMLSDPDLELNPRMPANFDEILLNLSNKYQASKISLALDISEKEKFVECKKYEKTKTIYDWEKQFWEFPIADSQYELYESPIDGATTFFLKNRNIDQKRQLRIAGDFTAKHLPWYKGYLKEHISEEELGYWKKGNKSSSILNGCITDT